MGHSKKSPFKKGLPGVSGWYWLKVKEEKPATLWKLKVEDGKVLCRSPFSKDVAELVVDGDVSWMQGLSPE